ncbi:MAG: coproporphyrinogen dehydrogenase HemZ [Clostridia bacterium]|nr:coproporphyrinogen dehydrogenase HemZ [Clostridia bacterium]
MKLYLNGAPRYASEQIMMMLFPKDRPEVVETRPEGDFAEIEIRENKFHILAKSRIYKDGVLHFGVDFIDNHEDELESKRRLHQALKVSFYKAALGLLKKAPEWGAMTGIRPAKVAAKLINGGKTIDETDEILGKTYFVQPARRALAIKAAVEGIKIEKSMDKRDISLYVGIPFCASRCKYCSFVSHSIDKAQHLVAPYIDTLLDEMKTVGESVRASGLKIKSLYIGGGTPTALSTPDLKRVMEGISENFDLSHLIEYTVEAGRPDTADREKIEMIASLGATRISVNPQTMDNRVLSLMGRNHTAEDIVRMVGDIREVSHMLINMDVIAGLPGDTYEGFCDTMEKVIALNPDNITVHTLAIKKGSTLKAEMMALPETDEVEAMVDFARERVEEFGYAPYYLYRQKYMSGNLENVGYAKPDCESVYNVLIMEELQTIVSLGAGGVTKLVDRNDAEIVRIFNPKYPYEYNSAGEKFSDTAQRINEFYGR